MKSAVQKRLLAVATLVLVSWSLSIPAAEQKKSHLYFDASLNLGVENFRWQEFDDRGQRLLTEQGPRLVAGLGLGNSVNKGKGWIYELQLQGYFGKVDYDGQDSNGIFTSSDTNYEGWRAEFMTGLRKTSSRSALAADLLLGVGADTWKRDIDDSSNANGAAVGGFTEEYTVYYGRVGAAILWPHRAAESYFQVGAKRPFSIDEDVDVFNVTLSPGEEWSAYAAYELRLRGGKGVSLVRFYYDSFRFSKSDSKTVGLSTVWQPESDFDVWGVNFGYVF